MGNNGVSEGKKREGEYQPAAQVNEVTSGKIYAIALRAGIGLNAIVNLIRGSL